MRLSLRSRFKGRQLLCAGTGSWRSETCQRVGWATIDPQVQAAQEAEMMNQGVITQIEAGTITQEQARPSRIITTGWAHLG